MKVQHYKTSMKETDNMKKFSLRQNKHKDVI